MKTTALMTLSLFAMAIWAAPAPAEASPASLTERSACGGDKDGDADKRKGESYAERSACGED